MIRIVAERQRINVGFPSRDEAAGIPFPGVDFEVDIVSAYRISDTAGDFDCRVCRNEPVDT